MATRPEERMTEPDMNAADLWLEEVYTDRRIGTIRKLTPVKGEGVRDLSREIQWAGETQVMSQIGTLPITLTDALAMGTGAADACQGATFTVYLKSV